MKIPTGYFVYKGVVTMGRKIATVLVCLLLLSGLGFILYPTASNWVNELHSSKNIASYLSRMETLSQEEIDAQFKIAEEFNKHLLKSRNRWKPSIELLDEYNKALNVFNSGIMSVVSIPRLNVSMSVYHGTSDTVLQVSAGHMEGSTLPIGGLGTHAVISGHTGLPSAELFTNLDQLELGDIFIVNTLNKNMAYKVCSINTVLPTEMEYLDIDKERDLVTLLTCTPYGVNSHRLLVTGERIELDETQTEEISKKVEQTEHIKITPTSILICCSSLFVLVMFIWLLVSNVKSNKKKAKHYSIDKVLNEENVKEKG